MAIPSRIAFSDSYSQVVPSLQSVALSPAPLRLVPVGKPTFPDQQHDLQNAAGFSLAIECEWSVKFARLGVKVDSAGFWSPGGVWVGWSVSEVRAAFVTSLTSLWRRGQAAEQGLRVQPMIDR